LAKLWAWGLVSHAPAGGRMGHVRVAVEIANPLEPDRSVSLPDALIDTGATRTLIPRRIADELGLEIRGSAEVQTAEGIQRVDRSFAGVTVNGRESIGTVFISDTYPGVLICVITLEDLGLAVDPKGQQLIDSPFLLL
jgi:aspartyl protease family protein